MSTDNPMSFYRQNVDAWGPLEWFDRLAKAVHARSQAVRDKDDIAFETYNNIASSSATRLVSDFEDKVRMALTTLRELEKANVAYVDANTELLSTLESLQREDEELRQRLDVGPCGEDAIDVAESAADHLLHRAEAAEDEVKIIREAVGELLDQAEHVCLGAHTPANIKEAARNLATPIKNVHTALASTGGEHHAE